MTGWVLAPRCRVRGRVWCGWSSSSGNPARWRALEWEVVPVCDSGQLDGVPSRPAAGPGVACTPDGQTRGEPRSVTEAARIAVDALAWLARADLASVPVAVQADCLRELERAVSVHTAARASVLSAFDAAAGYEDDAQGSPADVAAVADQGHRRGRVRIGRLDAAAPRPPGRRRGPGRRPDHRVLGTGDLRLDRPAARRRPRQRRPDPARRRGRRRRTRRPGPAGRGDAQTPRRARRRRG